MKNSRPLRYKLSKVVHRRYKERDGEVKCVSCGKELNLGEEVVSKVCNAPVNCSRVLRCLPCARRLNLIV